MVLDTLDLLLSPHKSLWFPLRNNDLRPEAIQQPLSSKPMDSKRLFILFPESSIDCFAQNLI